MELHLRTYIRTCINSERVRLGSIQNSDHPVLQQLQWNLSIKDTLNKGHLSTEDTVCFPNHTKLCDTSLFSTTSYEGLSLNCVNYREGQLLYASKYNIS